MKIRVSLIAFLSAIMLIACGGGDDAPLATAAEVKAAYDAEPSVLQSWFAEPSGSRGDIQMMLYPVDFFLPEPFRLVVFYQGRTIYDERHWLITERHAVTSDRTDVVLITEYRSAGDWSGSSVVFVNGENIAKIQSLPVSIAGYGDYPAMVSDIREWRDGWLIIFASLNIRGDYRANRYAMYHPKTREFVDCGEFGSNRDPNWGPPMSSICRYR